MMAQKQGHSASRPEASPRTCWRVTGSSGLLGWGWPEPRERPPRQGLELGSLSSHIDCRAPTVGLSPSPGFPTGISAAGTLCAGSQGADERAGPDLPAQKPPVSFGFRLEEAGGKRGVLGMRKLGNRHSLRPVRERAGYELLLGLQRQAVALWASDVLSHKERESSLVQNKLLFPFQEEKGTRGHGVSTLGRV